MTFALRIKKLREESGLTQSALAKELGIGASTVAMWETNDRMPTAQFVEKLADYFDVSVDYLLGRTNNKKEVILEGVYFRLASEAQELGVPPEDMEIIIDYYKKYLNREI